MKIKSLLIGMLASTAFVACTNDESPVNDTQAVAGGQESYVAVNLAMPGESRAAEDGGFTAGSGDENNVSKAVFLFLNERFEGCAEPCEVNGIDLIWEKTGLADHQNKKATTLVIKNGDKQVPAYIVAILNPTKEYSAQTGLAELKSEHLNFSAYNTKGAFVMSNSVYKGENGKEVVATPITIDHVQSTPELAQQNPVTISVERVVAKVNVENLSAAAAAWKSKETLTDGTSLETLKLNVLGWEVLQNNETNLIKKIDTAWDLGWNWNNAGYQRSYWAIDFAQGKRTSYKVEKMTNLASKYVEETVSPELGGAYATNPYLLVRGQFVDADNNVVELVEWRGEKYTKDGYLHFVASNPGVSQYYYIAGENADGSTRYASVSKEMLKLQDNTANDWEASTVLNTTVEKFYTLTFKKNEQGEEVVDTPTEVAKSVVAAAVEAFGNVQYWNNGNTYYYVPIEHQTTDNGSYYGVVRNHIYNVTISAINGFGTPVSDPDQAIDEPENPTDDKSYLAAEVVVLKWKVVNQSVTLGE